MFYAARADDALDRPVGKTAKLRPPYDISPFSSSSKFARLLSLRPRIKIMSLTLAAKLEALQSLAEVAKSALPLGMNSVVMTPEGVLGISRPPRPARLHFIADGLPFSVAVSPEGDGGSTCQVFAEIGHIPFSAQAPERRRGLLDILRGVQAQPLPTARFIVQQGQKILLFSESKIPGHVTPEHLAWQTATALQEARPFLRMLSEYL